MTKKNSIAGYSSKNTPDVGWWFEQVHKGEEDRKKKAFQTYWDTWRAYYRGDWRSQVMPVNLFYMMTRSVVPRVYFRNPKISITPAKPGWENMVFAKILERADNKMIRQMGMKKQIKRIVQDAFMFGTGFGKLGFSGFYTPTTLMDDVKNIEGMSGEYIDSIEYNMPWFSRVRPGNMILPAGLETYEHTRWVAEQVIRPLHDVKNDPRLTNTQYLKGVEVIPHGTLNLNMQQPVTMVKLTEIRDRLTGKVMVLHNCGASVNDHKVLFFGDDSLQQYGEMNYFPLIFNEQDDTAWGLPDSKILEPQQLEINEINTQIMLHRRLSLVKILVKEKGMTVEEAEKMVSEDVGAVAFTKGDPNRMVKVMETGTIPQVLFQAEQNVMQQVREMVGFSRNQFGEFNSRSGDTTATEAQIVQQSSDIRIDERRDMVADMLQNVVKHLHGLLFENWGEEEVIDVIGPGGIPVWIRFRSDLIKNGRYNINVDPDDAVSETRATRSQRAVQAYQLLKDNPMIDPMKLTQYLLNEMPGVEFDDLMKMLPAQGGVPQGPITPQDFAGMLQRSVSAVQGGAMQ